MPRFTEKPVTITAVQITDATFDSPHPNPDLISGLTYWPKERIVTIPAVLPFEGRMTGNMGDWIITGVNGEHYPCRNDMFEATYSPATEDAPDPQAARIATLTALLREQQSHHWLETVLARSMGSQALANTHEAMHNKIKKALEEQL